MVEGRDLVCNFVTVLVHLVDIIGKCGVLGEEVDDKLIGVHLQSIFELSEIGGEGDPLDGGLSVVLDEFACMQQVDASDLLVWGDVGWVFFTEGHSSGDSLVFDIKVDEPFDLCVRHHEVLILPEVVERVRSVEGMEVRENADGVISDLSDEACDCSIVVCVPVGDAKETGRPVGIVQLAREQCEDESVHLGPGVELSILAYASVSLTKGIWRHVV